MIRELQPIGEAEAFLPVPQSNTLPIRVIGTEAIRKTFDQATLQQALNARACPGVTQVALNPDAHIGYGAPIGCVMVSPSHIYPGPVGVDIKCSMSLIQFDLPNDAINDMRLRRELINAILERTPTGVGRGQREAKKSRPVSAELGAQVCVEGASQAVCEALGIPHEWAQRCEDSAHLGHNRTTAALAQRLEQLRGMSGFQNFGKKMTQLGSYGGGNHFGECEAVTLSEDPVMRKAAETFELQDGHVAFLSHCGSRGFGNILAQKQFKILEQLFVTWGTPFPANDKHLVYAPLGTPEANDYINDMGLGANFATVNHLLINALILEAFQQVIPGIQGRFIYLISHNIARPEIVDNQRAWVHRKGATRAFPAGHPALKNTRYADTGHPILLPGNPRDGSVVMVAQPDAVKTCYSVNHGAGRIMGRGAAMRQLNQQSIDEDFVEHDILTNCRQYPRDEAPAAYKDFAEVLRSVESAGLAKTVAKLKARFVIKDSSQADD